MGLFWARGQRGCEPSVVVVTISFCFIETYTICTGISHTEFRVPPLTAIGSRRGILYILPTRRVVLAG